MPSLKRYALYKLAECYFRLNDFRKTIETYQTFLKEHHDEVYVATANYRIGVCYELLGQRAEALQYYQNAVNSESKFGDDLYSSRRAKMKLETPLTSFDTLFIQAQNASKSGKYKNAETLLAVLNSNSTLSLEEKAEVEITIGETFFDEDSFAVALQHFQQASLYKLQQERWILPWSHFQSGMCHVKLNDKVSAKKEFEQVLEFDDYDFKNWLNVRAKRELEKLQK
jgi:tetratricopeptide (TPR) repeat protein